MTWFFTIESIDGDGATAREVTGTDRQLPANARIDLAALAGLEATLVFSDLTEQRVRIEHVRIDGAGPVRRLTVRLAAPMASAKLVRGGIELPNDVFARTVVAGPPPPPIMSFTAGDAASFGLPPIGLRLVHDGLLASAFAAKDLYVTCSGPPGAPLGFAIVATAVAESGVDAVRTAMQRYFAAAAPSVAVADRAEGTIEVCGAARAAHTMQFGDGRFASLVAGVIVGTPRGALLILATVGAGHDPTPASIAASPSLAGCFRSLTLDGGATTAQTPPPSWPAATRAGGALGATVASEPGSGGLRSVALDGWQVGLTTASLPRALGALFGLAVGDALGTTNEFQPLAAPAFPALATGPVTDVVGAGPFRLQPGEVTDDTQMAAALADQFARASAVTAGQLAARYLAWRTVAFDVGVQIGQALELIRGGEAPERAGRAVWEAKGRHPAGNGALMRTAVIGVMLAGVPEARRAASWLDAAITHFDPRCLLACAAFNASIVHALTTRPSPSSMVRAAVDELRVAADELRARHGDLRVEIDAAEQALAADLAAARDDDPDLYGAELHLHRTAGFVRVAFRLAYWELLHAPDYASAVIDAANRGGDADTNAAIVGALWGAFAGVDGVPAAWIERVLRAPGLASDGFEFHPRTFLHALARGFGADRNDHTIATLARWVAVAVPGAGEVPQPVPAPGVNVDGAPVEVWLRGTLDCGQGRVRGADGVVRIATLLPDATVAEPEPMGVALSLAALPLRGRYALPLAIEIMRAVERAGGVEHVDPTMIYVRGDSDRLAVSGLLLGGDRWARGHDREARFRFVSRALLCAAPEVLAGAPTVVSASFSCAAVLLYLLRRHGPYPATGPLVLAGRHDAIDGLSPLAYDAVTSALAADPRQRPPLAVVRELLEASLAP